MRSLAIIPARSGSKRIQRKNFRDFLGKPLIAYAIEKALKCGFFDEVMVSTDTNESAEIAKKYGANVPFLRSEINSNDFATTAEVLLEVIQGYKDLGITFDALCCIYPTSVLLTVDQLNEGYLKLQENNCSSLISIVKYPHPTERALIMKNGKKIEFELDEHNLARTQDLGDRYYDAAQFYWLRVKDFLKSKRIVTNNTGFLLFNSFEIQDIDTPNDWHLAILKFKFLNFINDIKLDAETSNFF